MLRGIVWQDPDTILDDIYTTRLRSLKRSPASRQPVANPSGTSRQPVADQSQHISNQSAINRQQVANQSPTDRRFLWTVLAHQSQPGPQLVVDDWLPIDLQLKRWRFWSHGGSLVAADFGHKAVADRLQFICDRDNWSLITHFSEFNQCTFFIKNTFECRPFCLGLNV